VIKHKIKSRSFFEMDKSVVETNDTQAETVSDKIDFDTLINAIKKDFSPEKVFDEKELQNMLRTFLETKFPNAVIEREVRTKQGDWVDVVVNGKFAFELKMPETRTVLRDLKAQLEEYQEEFSDLCAVIVDNPQFNLSEQIQDYSKKYESSGIRSVIVEGSKRG